jgi:uncharacterized protein YjeT (DUF2065 family)
LEGLLFCERLKKEKGKIMKIVIQSLGIIFILIAVLYQLKPNTMKSMIEFVKQGRRLYFAGLIRLVLAIVFLVGARECDVPWVMIALGVLLMMSGLLIFALGLEKIKSMINWLQKQPILILRVLALIALAVGAIVIYCA